MTVQDLPVLTIGGLSSGALYGLLAISIALVYRTTRLINFAQGELITIGAYAFLEATESKLSTPVQLLLVVGVGVVVGLVLFVITNYVLRGAKNDELTIVIGTLGVSILIVNALGIKYSTFPYPVTSWLVGSSLVHLGGTAVETDSIVLIVFGVALACALALAFRFTNLGRAVRAVAENRGFAALSGIAVAPMLALSWVLAAVMTGVAGMLVAPLQGVYPTLGGNLLFLGFVAATIGGFDSILGAILGGLLLGLIETFCTVLVGGLWNNVIAFGILIMILLWRPQGLFSRGSLRRA